MRILVIILVCLSLAAGVWGFSVNTTKAKVLKLGQQQAKENAKKLASDAEVIEALQAKLGQLSEALTATVDARDKAESKVREAQARLRSMEMSQTDKEAQTKLLTMYPANEVHLANGTLLYSDVQFSRLFGKTAIFKRGGEFVTVAVDTLHPSTLYRLNINLQDAEMAQAQLDRQNKATRAFDVSVAKTLETEAAIQRKENERRAAEAAQRQAELARQQWEDSLKERAAWSETVKAQAAMKAADAALFQAANPQPGVIIQNQNNQSQRMYSY